MVWVGRGDVSGGTCGIAVAHGLHISTTWTWKTLHQPLYSELTYLHYKYYNFTKMSSFITSRCHNGEIITSS